MESEMETIVDFIIEDLLNKDINAKQARNKITILLGSAIKIERKHLIKKWLFIGAVAGMALIRIFEFIFPYGN